MMPPLALGSVLRMLFCALALMDKVLVGACPSMCECLWRRGKQTVECDDRGLVTLPVGVASATQVLSLNKNSIAIVPTNKFRGAGLINLQRILMSACGTVQVESHALAGLTNLVELDLSHNRLQSVPRGVFADVPALMVLNLRANPIAKLDDSLAPLAQLTTLDLSGCQIEHVETGALANLVSVQWLLLGDNRLETLSTQGLPTAMHGFELHKNPWHCDCRLRDLQRLLSQYRTPASLTPICAAPAALRDIAVQKVRQHQFACPPRLLDGPLRLIESAEDDNVTLTCRVSADPGANVTWLIDGQSVLPTPGRYWLDESRPTAADTGTGSPSSPPHIISQLVIVNVSERDQGVFQCVATNRAGSAVANYSVRVLLPPDSSSFETAPVADNEPTLLWPATAVPVVVTVLAALAVIVTTLALAVAFVYRHRRARHGRQLPAGCDKQLRQLQPDWPSTLETLDLYTQTQSQAAGSQYSQHMDAGAVSTPLGPADTTPTGTCPVHCTACNSLPVIPRSHTQLQLRAVCRCSAPTTGTLCRSRSHHGDTVTGRDSDGNKSTAAADVSDQFGANTFRSRLDRANENTPHSHLHTPAKQHSHFSHVLPKSGSIFKCADALRTAPELIHTDLPVDSIQVHCVASGPINSSIDCHVRLEPPARFSDCQSEHWNESCQGNPNQCGLP